MYPLGMTRSLVVAASLVVLAAPATASAATLTVSPQKPCYSSGETVNLNGTGLTPNGGVTITREGTVVGGLTAFPDGAFAGALTLAQNSGKRTKTYTATDDSNPTLTASTQITVSSVGVSLSPTTGPPNRRMTIRAHGFSTGDTLWAHVRKGTSKRNLKIGALSGACGRLKTIRRLLPRDAAVGVYRIQFDTFRRYKARRPVRDRYTITVLRG
jgi:hypothetical protein